MQNRLTTAVRLLMGLIYTLNGLNWWVKMITPYPSQSDFVTMAPPPDVVGALINTHVMFHMVKALELLTGLALLSNMLVPLALVAVVPVTLSVFIVDVFFIAHLRGRIMGGGSLLMNLYLLMAYAAHYRGMLALRACPGEPDPAQVDAQPSLYPATLSLIRPLRWPVGVAAAALGFVMLVWMLVMIAQYIANPLPLSAVLPPHH